MGKRFIDTELWINKPWFIELSPKEKAAWYYLISTCDSVGVCNPVQRVANSLIGDDVEWDIFITKTNGNIIKLEGGKWWLKDFCYFQYGVLRDTCYPHRTYLNLLEKHGLLSYVQHVYTSTENKGSEYPYNSLVSSEQEKDSYIISSNNVKKEVKDKDIREDTKPVYQQDFLECWVIYPRKIGKQRAYKAYVTRRRQGIDKADLLLACVNYKQSMNGTEEKYIKHAATFFGPDEHWKDYIKAPEIQTEKDDFYENEVKF